MAAWKRIYIEEDQMYRSGADLAADFSPDTNDLPDSVTVVSRSRFGTFDFLVGDDVLVFDVDHPEGESATVTNIVGMTLYLDVDLTNSYDAGYGAGNGGAAVARPDPDGDDDIDVYDALLELFSTNAFGSATTGIDGGCFTELVPLANGSTRTPYSWSISGWNVGNRIPFSQYIPMWFDNRQKPNVFYLLGASSESFGLYGFEYTSEKAAVVLVGVIDGDPFIPNKRNFNGETVVHEFGHRWVGGRQVDNNHPHDARAHDDTDYCIMDYGPEDQLETIFSNGKTEFCVDGPDHLYEIRDKADAL